MYQLITNLFASSPGYWFKQKTLYSDFDLLLSRFSTLQIFYTIAFVLFGAIFFFLWFEEHKKRKTGKWLQWEINKENIFLVSLICIVLLILGTWLGR